MAIKIHESFLSDNDFDRYYNFVKNYDSWGESINGNVWSGRVIYTNHIQLLNDINSRFLNKVKSLITSDLKLDNEIWPDYLGLVRWRVGDKQEPHADGELANNQKHPYFWRNFGCVYYLNEDYEGGEIYFPNQKIELKPMKNTLVFFPGTLEYLHGVKEITKNVRYTLTSFWTYDINYKINYDYNTK